MYTENIIEIIFGILFFATIVIGIKFNDREFLGKKVGSWSTLMVIVFFLILAGLVMRRILF